MDLAGTPRAVVPLPIPGVAPHAPFGGPRVEGGNQVVVGAEVVLAVGHHHLAELGGGGVGPGPGHAHHLPSRRAVTVHGCRGSRGTRRPTGRSGRSRSASHGMPPRPITAGGTNPKSAIGPQGPGPSSSRWKQ